MARQLFSNNAKTTLATAVTPTDTTISVAAGDGTLFPAPTGGDWFTVTVVGGAGQLEVMKVTARTNDTFTVLRAQEGTTAQSFAAGDTIELRLTAGAMDRLLQGVTTATGNLVEFDANGDAVDSSLPAVQVPRKDVAETIPGGWAFKGELNLLDQGATPDGSSLLTVTGDDTLVDWLRLKHAAHSGNGMRIWIDSATGDAHMQVQTPDGLGSADFVFGANGTLKLNGKNASVQQVAVLQGNIGNGGTIPLPSGYSASQCVWIASAQDNITLGSQTMYYCRLVGRVVYVKYFTCAVNYFGNVTWYEHPGTAHYIVIGVK